MSPLEAATLARTGAIWARRPDIKTLEITGPDRVRYLNGQVSNDITMLGDGQGCLAVKTSAKGRTEALMRVRATPDALLLDLRAVVADATLAALARYIIMDDCEIRDVSAARDVLTMVGPTAGYAGAPAIAPHAFAEVDGVVVIRDLTLGIEGYELHVRPGHVPELGAPEAPFEALEILRIENGIPVDGQDLGPDVLPLEAHLEHAISTTKGCYSGQEVIARAMNLGGVQWSLVSLAIEGGTPAVGTELFADAEKSQGSITSLTYSPRRAGLVALAFVRRAQQAPGTRLRAGDSGAIATVL